MVFHILLGLLRSQQGHHRLSYSNNIVDDLVLDTFDFFFREASNKLNAEATQRSQHLTQGETSGNVIDPGSTSDLELDVQLESLRKKLAEVGKESEILNQEIHAFESQSSHNARYINEAVQLFEQNSYTELFQEIMTTASELRLKIGKLTTNKIEETGKMKAKRIDNNKMDISAIYASKGLSNTKFEDLEEFVTLMKST